MLDGDTKGSLDPNSMSVAHEKHLMQLTAEKGTSQTHLLFKDGSRFDFEFNSASPNYRTIGEKTSFSYAFASDIKEFNLRENGFTVVFKDNSRWDFDISNLL